MINKIGWNLSDGGMKFPTLAEICDKLNEVIYFCNELEGKMKEQTLNSAIDKEIWNKWFLGWLDHSQTGLRINKQLPTNLHFDETITVSPKFRIRVIGEEIK
jgi:hypothetical protein